MLHSSVNFSKTERTNFFQQDESLKSIEFVRGKLEIILEELVAQKDAIEYRYMEQKKSLEEEIQTKNVQIDKLEQKIRQLQGENQQIKYQYQQRVTMMGILKNQNIIITKEFQREKNQLKLTLEALVRENRQLKDALIEAHFKERRMNKSPSRQVLLGDYIVEKHFSYEDFDRAKIKTKKYSQKGRDRLLTEGVFDTQAEQQNLSRSSIAAILRSNPQIQKQSRMTRIKRRGGEFNFQEGLQKMSTKTHLSRQRSPFQ